MNKTKVPDVSIWLCNKTRSTGGLVHLSGIANPLMDQYNDCIADVLPMHNRSFPDLDLSHGLPSAVQALTGSEQTPSFSSLVKSNQALWNGAWSSQLPDCSADINPTFEAPTIFHADPLAPLRQRDEEALEGIFDDTQMEEIFVDICDRLKQLYPEPCWDDDQFEFLQDYI